MAEGESKEIPKGAPKPEVPRKEKVPRVEREPMPPIMGGQPSSLERIWQNERLIEAFPDLDVKDEEFREITREVEREIKATPEEKAYLRLVRRWRESQEPLRRLRTNPRLINPEEPKAINQDNLIKEPDIAAILDPLEVREAIARFSYQIRKGQYEDRPDLKIFGEGYEELVDRSLHEQIALQFLDAWLVHPDPTEEGEAAQWVDDLQKYPILWTEYKKIIDTKNLDEDYKLRKKRFKEYQPAHDGVWNQFPLKRWPELVAPFAPFLPNGEEFNLMVPEIKKEWAQTEGVYDPEKDKDYDGPLVNFPKKNGKQYKWDGKSWYIGDYFKWAGFTPEELVEGWDKKVEGREEPLKEIIRKGKDIKGFIAYYWQIRRAYNTSVDLNGLLKEKKITPLTVREKLAGRYDYISGRELVWMRNEMIRPIYKMANDGVIALLQRTAAKGEFPRANLYQAVTEMGLYWMEFKERLGYPELGVGIDFAQFEGAETTKMQMGRLLTRLWEEQEKTGEKTGDLKKDLKALWKTVLKKTGIELELPVDQKDNLLFTSFERWCDAIKEVPVSYEQWRFNLQTIIERRQREGKEVGPLIKLLDWDPAQRLLTGGKDPETGEEITEGKSLMGLYWENNYRRIFRDYFEQVVETGGALSWKEKEAIREEIRKTYEKEIGLSPEQYRDLLDRLDKIPEAGTFLQNLKDTDWLVHHRWPTLIPLLGFSVELFTMGRWKREESGWYDLLWKWTGVSPSVALTAGSGWTIVKGIEAYAVGRAIPQAFLEGLFNTFVRGWPISYELGALASAPYVWLIGGTIALTLIDRYIIKFTKGDYKSQKFRERQRR